MSELEFSTISPQGESFEAVDPRSLGETSGFSEAVEEGLAERERTHNLLAALRLAAGITQEEAAAAWGRAQPHVSRLERLDLRVAQVNTIASYVAALGGSLHLTIELGGARFDVPIAADDNDAVDPAA
jgi:hypothetical protein